MAFLKKIFLIVSWLGMFSFILPSCTTNKSVVKSATSIHPEDAPVVFRRTTLIVHDIDESLLLYRDAMGMNIIYDNVISRPHPDGSGNQQEIRLVFLKATHDYVGVIGLVDYEFNNPNKVRKESKKEGFTPQNSVLLFNTNNLASNFAKISKVTGVEVVKQPGIRKYPSYDGTGTIEVLVSIFYDPDGFLVEYNQILSGM